jgi:transcriptional regulator with XRE-family HTH domain
MKLQTQQVEQIDNVATGAMARAKRIKSGKSLRKVATALGFTASFLSDLERGRRNWNADLLSRFERAVK